MLKETYGVPVYQEQVMEMAQVVAGFTLGQADILRRAMGKKKPEEMMKMKEKFLAGAKAKGYDTKTGERIFDLLFVFSGYGFNKSHAAAYTIPAYHTIWLKANHPAEFIAANCTNDMNDTDRLAQLIHEAREMGIEVLPPDVNVPRRSSRWRRGRSSSACWGSRTWAPARWTPSSRSGRRTGLSRASSISSQRIDSHEVNRKVAESLIITGAFDRLGETRATLMHNLGTGDGAVGQGPGGKAVRAGVAVRGRRGGPPRLRSSWNASRSCPPPSCWRRSG